MVVYSRGVQPSAGVSNPLAKYPKVLMKFLDGKHLIKKCCGVSCGYRPGPGLFVLKSSSANQNVQLCKKMHTCSKLDNIQWGSDHWTPS